MRAIAIAIACDQLTDGVDAHDRVARASFCGQLEHTRRIRHESRAIIRDYVILDTESSNQTRDASAFENRTVFFKELTSSQKPSCTAQAKLSLPRQSSSDKVLSEILVQVGAALIKHRSGIHEHLGLGIL